MTKLFVLSLCLRMPAASATSGSSVSHGSRNARVPNVPSENVASSIEKAVGVAGLITLAISSAGCTRRNLRWLTPLACDTRVRKPGSDPLRYVRPKASLAYDAVKEQLLDQKWVTYHFDNYAHKFYVRAFSLGLAGVYRPAMWTAWGFTFTSVNASEVSIQTEPSKVRAWPDTPLLEQVAALAEVKRTLRALAESPDIRKDYRQQGSADICGDYRYPLGAGGHPRVRMGTAYQPLELWDENCGKNKDLVRILTKVGCDLVAPRPGPVVVRVDVANYWKIVKALGNKSLGVLGDKLAGIIFWLPPWHTYKHLAEQIWHTISPGAFTLILASVRTAGACKAASARTGS